MKLEVEYGGTKFPITVDFARKVIDGKEVVFAFLRNQNDITSGVAVCSPKDIFVESIGARLALKRAYDQATNELATMWPGVAKGFWRAIRVALRAKGL